MRRVQMSSDSSINRDNRYKGMRRGSRARTAVMLAGSLLLLALLEGCAANVYPPPVADCVKLRIVCSAGDIKWKRGMEDMAEAFMEANEGIEAELYFVPEIKNQTYAERLKVLAAQDGFYDIIELRESRVIAKTGLLAPLPQSVYSLVENPQFYGGVCYSVPRYTNTLGMIYNKTLFDELGLSGPENYEDFLDICRRVKRAGYDAIALGADDRWHMKFWGNYLFCNYISEGKETCRWTRERTEAMLSDFRSLAEAGYIAPEYRNMPDSRTAQAISSGQAAMVYTGPWMLSQIESLNPQIRLGFFFLPGKSGHTYRMNDRNVEWGIASKTAEDKEKMEAAVSFLQFYYSEGVYEDILELMNGESVTVRRVEMPYSQNQRILEEAYAVNSVYTDFLPENTGAPDGFVNYYSQVLIDTLWGGESIPSLTERLMERWEEP